MSAPTPGPWRRGRVDIPGSTPLLICGAADDNEIVALVSVLDSRWEDNARLIAAAPELLEALERIALGLWAGSQGNRPLRMVEAQAVARAAIAKARGSLTPE